jgi:hypothetical protein
MVRYYGYYSNVSRGKRKIQDKDDALPSILEPDGSSKGYRKNWARLIQKIYEVDPLTCPKCQNQMKIISVIENEEVIKKILKHLGLWDVKTRPPPRKEKPSGIIETPMDFSVSQLPPSEEHLYFDVEYPVEDPVFSG